MMMTRQRESAGMTSIWLAILLVCYIPFASALGEKGCITSLNTIYEAEQKVEDDSILRKYILCNNTEFHVALNFAPDGTPLDGQYPIPIGRSNIHVLCGENGSSDNNCQLVRGLVHVGIVDEFAIGASADNILLQGLTFFRATSVNIIAMIGGDITIRDCIFKRNRNVASIYAVAPLNTPRRLMQSDNSKLLTYLDSERRRTEESMNITKTDLHISIHDSVFSDNVLGASPGADTTAVVYSVGASMEMTNSVIVGTTKHLDAAAELCHMIYLESAPMVLQDNCFIGNDEETAPVVAMSATVDAKSNFNAKTTSKLSSSNCEFIAHNSTFGNFVCEPSDASTCTAKSTSQYRYPCVTYLDDIYFSEWDVTDSSIPRTYLLCPDTTFRVGSRHDADGTPLGGSYPIILGRSNIRVICGVDGRIENGCEVVNGVVQVAHFDEFQTGGRPIFNSLVSGISFSGASAINALVSGMGDVTFRDCVFQDNSNVASAYVQVLPPGRGRRNLQSTLQNLAMASDQGSDNRLLSRASTVDTDALVARFEDCLFVNNTIGTAANPISGLITNQEATVAVSNSMIINTKNQASDEYLGYYEVGYLVGNFNGGMTLEGNCFYDNEVTIAPVINRGSIQASFNSGRQAMAPTGTGSLLLELLPDKTSRAGNAEEHALMTTGHNGTANNASGWEQNFTSFNVPIDHANARCEFIATISEDVLGSHNPELITFNCKGFGSSECANPSAPTSAPSMSPSISPSPTSQSQSTSMPSLATAGDNQGTIQSEDNDTEGAPRSSAMVSSALNRASAIACSLFALFLSL